MFEKRRKQMERRVWKKQNDGLRKEENLKNSVGRNKIMFNESKKKT